MQSNPRKAGPPPDAASPGAETLWQSLLSNLAGNPEAGTFRVFDQRLLLLRPESFVDLQKHLEDTVGLSSKGFLYLAGEKSAREGHDLVTSLASSPVDASDPLDVLRRRIAAISLLGWGRLSVTVEDAAAQRYLVGLENSPIAEAYGDSEKPVCHLLAGWIAGTAQSVFAENLLCEEIACRAQGRARCEFRLRPTPYG